jgi:hypothetical protein
MEDRIQVNGVWYVKETTKAVSDSIEIENIDEFDVTRSLSRVWENDDYAFEAKILLAPDGTELEDTWGDCWLTITEKVGHTNASWVEHSIDNPTWMLGVYEGDPLSMEEATKMMTSEGIRLFRDFLSLLIKNGWLKKEIK